MGLLVFAAECPRQKKRAAVGGEQGGRGHNTTKHAETVLSTVRERATGRNRQKTAESRKSAIFLETLRGLAKKEPQPRPPRQPVPAKHMRQLHAALDLEVSHEDRAFWCLTLGAWLGVRRIGDFLRSRGEMHRE